MLDLPPNLDIMDIHQITAMQKIALGIEYHGANYLGFQRQNQGQTIQGAIEDALSVVAQTPIQIICAGRTDRGVHAYYQVIHFETDVKREDIAWVLGTNANLPKDIKVLWMQYVPNDFHARYSALFRRYLYVIYNHRIAPGIMHQNVSWVVKPLDHHLMQQGAQYLVGEHDFSSFRAAECQAKSPIRTIEHIHITRSNEYIFIDIKANAFLHNMVRNIVGTLIPVGRGYVLPTHVETILNQRDRRQAGVTAKPNGLYFIDVGYAKEFNLPKAKASIWQIMASASHHVESAL